MEHEERYQVIVSDQATQMLVSHAAFLSKVSPDAAMRLADEFEAAANSLEVMPQRCPWFSGEFIPRHTYRYLIFGKRYAILFQVIDDKVFADYVLDFRQDYGWLFP